MVTLAQLELLSFYLVNLFLLSLSHLHPLSLHYMFIWPCDSASCVRLIRQIEQDRCFPFHHGLRLRFGQLEERKRERRGQIVAGAGSSSSAFGRSLTDFLTSHRYIDSRCHLGGFSDVQGSGTWGWWSASIGCVSFRIVLKPTAFWPGHFDDSVDTHFDNICASARY